MALIVNAPSAPPSFLKFLAPGNARIFSQVAK